MRRHKYSKDLILLQSDAVSCIIPGLVKKYIAFIFRIKQEDIPQQVERGYYSLQLLFLDCLALNMKVI
jgi:hypothetical protein